MPSTRDIYNQRIATEAREHPAFLQFSIVAPNDPDDNDIADWVEDWKMFYTGTKPANRPTGLRRTNDA